MTRYRGSTEATGVSSEGFSTLDLEPVVLVREDQGGRDVFSEHWRVQGPALRAVMVLEGTEAVSFLSSH